MHESLNTLATISSERIKSRVQAMREKHIHEQIRWREKKCIVFNMHIKDSLSSWGEIFKC